MFLTKPIAVSADAFFVRDMVEEFEIVVPYVNTLDNISDFLTKAFKHAKAFTAMRDIVMNVPRGGS